jgi:MFS transporter, UMF1 family
LKAISLKASHPWSKRVWAWAIYDWANSAFATTVMAGFFPVFFKEYWSAGADVNLSTARLGFTNALAGILVAAAAPILGTMADHGGGRKKYLLFFAYVGVAMTSGLFWIGKGRWELAMAVYAGAFIAFSGANVFYDSLLPHVASPRDVDRVSALGYALGYLGGGLLFLFNVTMTLKPHFFGFSDSSEAVRFSFLTVALWWGGFTLVTGRWVSDPISEQARRPFFETLRFGFRHLSNTFRQIREMKATALFLIAYWFYIDGVDTIVGMAVDYGLSLGFKATDLIRALLLVQFIGFPAAVLFGKLADRWGARTCIFIAIGVYMAVTVWAALMTRLHEFYLMAAAIGLVQGGIQALSRSYYSRLIPKDQSAEFFGFYNMVGKFAAILGPMLIGLTGLAVRRFLMPPFPTADIMISVGRTATRWGIVSVIVLFIIGGICLYFAKGTSNHGSQ